MASSHDMSRIRMLIGTVLVGVLAACGGDDVEEPASATDLSELTTLPPADVAVLARRAVEVVGMIEAVVPSGASTGSDVIAASRQPIEQALSTLDRLIVDLENPSSASPSTSTLLLAMSDYRRALVSYLGGGSANGDPISTVRTAMAAADTRFRDAIDRIEAESGEQINSPTP